MIHFHIFLISVLPRFQETQKHRAFHRTLHLVYSKVLLTTSAATVGSITSYISRVWVHFKFPNITTLSTPKHMRFHQPLKP